MTDITLPRYVVELAIEAMRKSGEQRGSTASEFNAIEALRAALDQPQVNSPEIPEGWRLVPVEPTDDMLYDIQEYSHILPPRGKRIWAHMLAAAPEPPALEQPQGEQEPVAWINPGALEWGKRQCEKVLKLTRKAQPEYDFTEPLYTHPQPPRQPLTDEQWLKLWTGETGQRLKPGPERYRLLRRFRFAERAHGIGG